MVPGLDHTGSANVHFQIRYYTRDSAPSGKLTFTYRAGGVDLESTKLDWLVITNDVAVVQGTATIRGRDTTFPFRLTAAGATGLRVYPAGANPGTSVPMLQASGDISGHLLTHS